MTITASTILKTKFGDFTVRYHEINKDFCVTFSYGDLSKGAPIVRIHSACLFGEAFLPSRRGRLQLFYRV